MKTVDSAGCRRCTTKCHGAVLRLLPVEVVVATEHHLLVDAVS